MSGMGNSRGAGQRRIDDEAMGAFLEAVRRGAALEDAARAAGFTLGAFWKARKRDPAFAEAVEEAMELSNAPRFIRAGNGRKLQLRRHRRLRFVAWRRELFLEHLAGTCNEVEAAAAVGVSPATVYRHRMKDPEFAALHQLALDQGYVRLEAEALRQRLQAQQRLAEALDNGFEPKGELALEFDRVMKLLARWERRSGRVGPRTVSPERSRAWTADEALEALERKLSALGIPIRAAPPPGPGNEDDGEVE
jgi:hypothetical protein